MGLPSTQSGKHLTLPGVSHFVLVLKIAIWRTLVPIFSFSHSLLHLTQHTHSSGAEMTPSCHLSVFRCELVWTSFNWFELVWTGLNWFELVGTSLNRFQPVETGFYQILYQVIPLHKIKRFYSQLHQCCFFLALVCYCGWEYQLLCISCVFLTKSVQFLMQSE